MAMSCAVRELCRMPQISTAVWKHEQLALQAGVVLVYVAKGVVLHERRYCCIGCAS